METGWRTVACCIGSLARRRCCCCCCCCCIILAVILVHGLRVAGGKAWQAGDGDFVVERVVGIVVTLIHGGGGK